MSSTPAPARTGPEPGARRGPWLGSAGSLVGRELSRLQGGYLADRSDAVATLARLRRGAGRDPMSVPDLWGVVDLDSLYEDEWLRSEEAMSQAQNAVYATLALYALHQQSSSQGMHRADGTGLGSAVRALMPRDEIGEAVLKRFIRTGAATTFPQLTVRLRELVTLLKRDGLAQDYALLADQLHRWQRPQGRDAVRQQWGRSYHQFRRDKNPADSPADSADIPAEH